MTAIDPADLITDYDLASVREWVDQGAGLDITLYEHAPEWRARWVAEALEQVVSELRKSAGFTANRQLGAVRENIADDLSERASEYRAGQR